MLALSWLNISFRLFFYFRLFMKENKPIAKWPPVRLIVSSTHIPCKFK